MDSSVPNLCTTISDSVFLTDMLFSSKTAYYMNSGGGHLQLVDDLESIQKHYVRSKAFLCDVSPCVSRGLHNVFSSVHSAFVFHSRSRDTIHSEDSWWFPSAHVRVSTFAVAAGAWHSPTA
jgi:hypothetical protein